MDSFLVAKPRRMLVIPTTLYTAILSCVSSHFLRVCVAVDAIRGEMTRLNAAIEQYTHNGCTL